MNLAKALELIDAANLPSERSRAINWLLLSEESAPFDVLIRALEMEPVPQIRGQIRRLIEKRSKNAVRPLAQEPTSVEHTELFELLNNAAAIIRHETEPQIGLLRLAASRDIVGFESSQTNVRIENLRETLNTIDSLLLVNSPVTFVPCDICELLQEIIGSFKGSHVVFHENRTADSLRIINTSPGLFKFIMNNSIRNAIEACKKSLEETPVIVRFDVNETDFTVIVTNPFGGNTLKLEDVIGVGASSKGSSRGQGLNLMRLCSKRIGYRIDLQGKAGVAQFSLRGSR